MAVGEMDRAGFTHFLETALGLMAQSSQSGSLIYVCMDWRHMAELPAAAQTSLLTLLNLCVWSKPNAGMGSLYRSQHELVFVFKVGTGAHCNNVQLGRYGRHRSNVWSYAGNPGFGRPGEEGTPCGAASDRQTGGAGRRRHSRLLAAGQHHCRSLPWQRHDFDGPNGQAATVSDSNSTRFMPISSCAAGRSIQAAQPATPRPAPHSMSDFRAGGTR